MKINVEQKILSYVSRETYEKFKKYQELISAWNRQTSLVQLDSLNLFMERHILDSLQLLPLVSRELKTIDIGTGAGFPGMVLAIAGVKNITLCDSTFRKTVFLNEIKRLFDVDVEITCCRVEDMKDRSYEQIITRACADLATLLSQSLIVSRETKEKVTLFALKGHSSEGEIIKAREKFSFNYEKIDSTTNANGVILRITDIMKL